MNSRTPRIATEKSGYPGRFGVRVISPECLLETRMTEFNWMDHIVIPRCEAIAVYRESDGEICIRQQGADGVEDSIIYIPPDRLEALVKALQELQAK